MEWGILVPIVAVSAWPIGWVLDTWIKARHGYPIEMEKGEFLSRDGTITDARERQLLISENERLSGQVVRLEERLGVLERIATDPAERTARAIDALR